MGSAALAAAVPYPGKATRISCNGSKNSNKIKKKLNKNQPQEKQFCSKFVNTMQVSVP